MPTLTPETTLNVCKIFFNVWLEATLHVAKASLNIPHMLHDLGKCKNNTSLIHDFTTLSSSLHGKASNSLTDIASCHSLIWRRKGIFVVSVWYTPWNHHGSASHHLVGIWMHLEPSTNI